LLLDLQRAVIEKILHEPDGLRVRERKFIQMDRLLIQIAGMKKFYTERQTFRRPQRLVVAELDLAILVVIQIVLMQHRRQFASGEWNGLWARCSARFGHIIQSDLRGFHCRPDTRQCDCRHKIKEQKRLISGSIKPQIAAFCKVTENVAFVSGCSMVIL